MTAAVQDQPAVIAPAPESASKSKNQSKSFSLRDVPWGKVGTIIKGGTKTAAQAAKLGGLDFQVAVVDAGFRSLQPVPKRSHSAGATTPSPWKTVGTRHAVIHAGTEAFFDYVSSDYVPVQYTEAFAFMDGINPNYVAAGTMGGGKQAFMVVQLPNMTTVDLEVAGAVDPMQLYCILRTSHDRSKALEVAVLVLRGRCMNALTLSSFTQGAQQRWSIRHIGDPLGKLQQARTSLFRTEAYVEGLRSTAQHLGEIDLELEAAQEVLRTALPDRPKRAEQITAITDAWRHSDTIGKEFSTNGWGLTQAVSEYFEWGRNEGTRTAASRFTGGLNGATHKYTDRTAQLLLRRR